jgi:hypothetical protein
MPKDEFDFDDPLELNGVAIYTDEDTQRDMAECFVEEFVRLGYNHKQLLALFRNPNYLGMNMVLLNKGEAFVKEVIGDVCARWGGKIEWRDSAEISNTFGPPNSDPKAASEQTVLLDQILTDLLGNPIPKLNL